MMKLRNRSYVKYSTYALIAAFGSAENVKHASAEEIAAIDGFSPALAREILKKLNGAGIATDNSADNGGGKSDASFASGVDSVDGVQGSSVGNGGGSDADGGAE